MNVGDQYHDGYPCTECGSKNVDVRFPNVGYNPDGSEQYTREQTCNDCGNAD